MRMWLGMSRPNGSPEECQCCGVSPKEVAWSNERRLWTCFLCHFSELLCCQNQEE